MLFTVINTCRGRKRYEILQRGVSVDVKHFQLLLKMNVVYCIQHLGCRGRKRYEILQRGFY